MADRENMWEDNVLDQKVPGYPIFFVDRECILCAVCVDTAPNNFAISDDEDHDRVIKQPENEEELAQCMEAMENCPVEAIGTYEA